MNLIRQHLRDKIFVILLDALTLTFLTMNIVLGDDLDMLVEKVLDKQNNYS